MSADHNATIATETPPGAHGCSLQRMVSHHGRTHLDLFSGIGGFALAARWTGWNTIALSEIEPYACKILAKNFPGVPNLGDIRNVRGIACDLITGGFPCQPYSLAGKRRGASDDRALWPEMLRVIADSKPRWVLGENVPGIISLELDRVLADLENLGYSAWPLVLPACALDARHRRDRVWIVAHAARGQHQCGGAQPNQRTLPRGDGEENGTVADAAQRQNHERKCGDVGEAIQRREGVHAAADSRGETMADADRLNGRARTGRQNGAQARHDGETVSDDGCGSGEGPGREIGGATQPARWLAEPDVGRVADGIPRRMDRLRGLGNAIVPQVAAALMREMARTENKDSATWKT